MSEIKQVITHAAIRVARVGNSPDEYLLLPDLIGEPIIDPGTFRDAEGRIKRQKPTGSCLR